MTGIKLTLGGGTLAALMGAGVLAAATPAAADVACNRFGECWRVREHYTTYPGHLRVVFHDDAWAEHHRHGHWRWRRDRDDDHGYYMHGRWRTFDR
jgi:hypothetical protein